LNPSARIGTRRRRGLGKAVVLHAMYQMQAAGVTHATVANTGTNEAPRALHEACEFEPCYLFDDYVEPVDLNARNG
jgi:L-amino acid N-acyltransferase YncA